MSTATTPKPYYSDDWVTLYCGDSREIVPMLSVECATVVTDPVWPNCVVELFGKDDPVQMLASVLSELGEATCRLAIHMGVDSDPRFLNAVPTRWDFFRACWLEYARPNYKGRLLAGVDVAYLFGEPPKARPGAHIIPGKCMDTSSDGKQNGHPCPRKLSHAKWLINKWSDPGDVILDPFAGGGTTLRACRDLGRRGIGIEFEERYCEEAVKTFAQGVLPLPAELGQDVVG